MSTSSSSAAEQGFQVKTRWSHLRVLCMIIEHYVEKMKRSFNDSYSVRSTSGCLPVPIFNQKKRNRQPLTSVPQKNELNANAVTESFDYSGISSDLVLDNRAPQSKLGQKLDSSLHGSHPVLHHMVNQQYKLKAPGYNVVSTGEKQDIWPSDKNVHQNSSFVLDNNEQHSLQARSQAISSDHVSISKKQLLTYVPLSGRTSASLYSFRKDTGLVKENMFTYMPEEEKVQKDPIFQATFKEKSNSLRIIPICIDGMKHWSQFVDSVPLLFEVLATLDSAVTCGDHGSKTFLLRDAKNVLPCIFYEIDRDLPRLIRGRVHRSMGNFDKKRNVFKCVNVRPASLAEQQTFQKFVTAAHNEMEQLVKTINEV